LFLVEFTHLSLVEVVSLLVAVQQVKALGPYLSHSDHLMPFIQDLSLNFLTLFCQDDSVREAVKYFNNGVTLVFSCHLYDEGASQSKPQHVKYHEKEAHSFKASQRFLDQDFSW